MPPTQTPPPPVMPPPVATPPIAPAPAAPTQAPPVISPIQVPPPPPPMDVRPPAPPMPAPGEHSHVAAIASGALFIGLILGAAAGYYGSKFQTMLEQTAAGSQLTQQEMQDQSEAQATAESYSDIETNPLEDVQTNPFE